MTAGMRNGGTSAQLYAKQIQAQVTRHLTDVDVGAATGSRRLGDGFAVHISHLQIAFRSRFNVNIKS